MADNFLHGRHADESSKLHGLLAGVAASGIAFAFHETSDRTMDTSTWLIFAGVLAWALSFAFGILSRRTLMMAIKSNVLMHQAEDEGSAEGVKISKGFLDKHSSSMHRQQEVQLWSLLAGAVLYAGGHILHMQSNQIAQGQLAEIAFTHAPPPDSVAGEVGSD